MHSIAALTHLVAELQASSKRVLEYSRNKSASGLHREKLVASYIRKVAPRMFDIGSGFIYGATESSSQIDIIVYDRHNYAPLYDEGGYVVVLPASVAYIVEVKSYLDKNAVQTGVQNIESAKRLCPKCHGLIFAFDGLGIDTIAKHMCAYFDQGEGRNMNLQHLPNIVVTLDKWVLLQTQNPEAGSEVIYVQPKGPSFSEQFLMVFSDIYYSLYGYAMQMQRGDRQLPTLEEQGFQTKSFKWVEKFAVSSRTT